MAKNGGDTAWFEWQLFKIVTKVVINQWSTKCLSNFKYLPLKLDLIYQKCVLLLLIGVGIQMNDYRFISKLI